MTRKDSPPSEKESIIAEDLWDKPLIISHQTAINSEMFSPIVSYLRSWSLYRMEKISGLFEGFQRFFTTTPKRIRKYGTIEFSNLKPASPFPSWLIDNLKRKNFFDKRRVFTPKMRKLSLTEIKHIFEV